MFGNMHFGNDTDIVQHQRTMEYIMDPAHFTGEKRFFAQSFGPNQTTDRALPRRATVVLRDEDPTWRVDMGDGVVLEARYLGFAQTGGDLWVVVRGPGVDVLFAGNAVIARPPAVPWLLDGHAGKVLATLRVAAALCNTSTVVVPGHDRATDVGVFSWMN
eukprot:Sspe_Gene.15338::Locus_5340_Transcript_1_1_Confidence_1.000_Length_828::g.15338::m.15338